MRCQTQPADGHVRKKEGNNGPTRLMRHSDRAIVDMPGRSKALRGAKRLSPAFPRRIHTMSVVNVAMSQADHACTKDGA